MDQHSTTFNIDELITAYIDNQIQDSEVKAYIKELIDTDETIQKKYRCELLTKNYLRDKIPLNDPPRHALQMFEDITNTIRTKEKRNFTSFSNTDVGFLNRKISGIPFYAYALVFLLLLTMSLLFFITNQKSLNPYIVAGTDKNIMVQALNSFHKILKGEVKPHYTSSNASEVEKYISENASFKPHVPQIHNYNLIGVLCNDYNGQKLAHLIYKNSQNEVFYIYQTSIQGILSKELELPEDIHREIIKDKFYMCDQVDENNCIMTLWFKNDVVCASLSNMSKEQMHTTYINFIK